MNKNKVKCIIVGPEGLIVGLVKNWQADFFSQQNAINILPPKSRCRHHACDLPAVSQSMSEMLKNKTGENIT